MRKKQRYLSTGTVYIPLANIRELYENFLKMKNQFPSCNILFTTLGIKDVNMIAAQYYSNLPRDFRYAHEKFFSKYTDYTPFKEPNIDSLNFRNNLPVKFDTLLQLRQSIVELRKNGYFKRCVIYYTVSIDLSHAYIYFYAHDSDTLIEFSNLMSSRFQEFLYLEG